MLNKIKNLFYGFLLLHALWFLGTHFVNDRLIPSPLLVYANMDAEFWLNMIQPVGHSLWRLFLGISISIIIGLVLGLLMAQSKIVGKVLNPFIYFTYPIPKMAFLPVVMLLRGLGNPTIITMIILIIVFQIIINVRDGINSIPEENYQTVLVLGANKWQLFKNITLPAALSQILSSTRVALGTATAILFITEDSGNIYGIGRFIFNAQSRIDFVNVYSGIVVLSIIAFILFLIVDTLEAVFMQWNK
jgi:NitT/TauT family transport system permease protein